MNPLHLRFGGEAEGVGKVLLGRRISGACWWQGRGWATAVLMGGGWREATRGSERVCERVYTDAGDRWC